MAELDIIRIDVNSTFQKNPNLFCTYWVVTAADSSGDDVNALLNSYSLNVVTPLQAIYPVGIEVDCLVGQTVDPLPASIPQVFAETGPGIRMGAELPGQCSAVVQQLPTQLNPTARQRGRDFWTGLVETDQVDGLWVQATANLVLGFYNDELIPGLSGAAGGTYGYVVWSKTQRDENDDPQYVSNGGSTPDPPTFGDLESYVIDRVRMVAPVRTQRRRQAEDPCLALLEEL